MQEHDSDFIEDSKIIYDIDGTNDTTNLAAFGRALSSPVRIQMIRLVNKKNMLASEVAAELNLPLSSAIFHLNILEEAGIIQKSFSTKGKGTLHWFTYGTNLAIIRFRNSNGYFKPESRAPYVHQISIGEYIDAEFSEQCGIATAKKQIMSADPHNAFVAGRQDAQIIWSEGYGSLLYAIPNNYAQQGQLKEITISLEICSEAPGFNNNYPSDITFSINGTEICTFVSPGDYGDRYGKLTPSWWYPESTKYGILTNISIRSSGVFLNEKLVNKSISIHDLKLQESNKTTFGIAVKKDAKHPGGFNIFGSNFGDYAQPIIFTATYK